LRHEVNRRAGMQKSVHSRQYSVFIEELVKARKSAKLTQQVLADRLGKPQSFVAKYEKGERRLDVIEFLEIAQQIGVDPHAIIDAVG
jgi:transcriptional regulator with XRE-family HTH domain